MRFARAVCVAFCLFGGAAGLAAETRQQTNLQAFGFGSFGSAFANVPKIVGPFNVFDARAYVSQSVLDLGAQSLVNL